MSGFFILYPSIQVFRVLRQMKKQDHQDERIFYSLSVHPGNPVLTLNRADEKNPDHQDERIFYSLSVHPGNPVLTLNRADEKNPDHQDERIF